MMFKRYNRLLLVQQQQRQFRWFSKSTIPFQSSEEYTGNDPMELLTNDHRLVFQMYENDFLSNNNHPQKQKEIMNNIINNIAVHSVTEEQVVYPLLSTFLKDGSHIASENIEEHQEVKNRLQFLWDAKIVDYKFKQVSEEVMKMLKEHTQKEENEIFPKLKESMSHTQLSMLLNAIIAAKKIAPNRPHPHSPSTAPFNWFVGPVAGTFDKLRDALGIK